MTVPSAGSYGVVDIAGGTAARSVVGISFDDEEECDDAAWAAGDEAVAPAPDAGGGIVAGAFAAVASSPAAVAEALIAVGSIVK